MYTVSITLLRVAPENNYPANSESISGTAVGFLIGGVVAGALGVLLMVVGIVYGVWRLTKIKRR